MARFEWDEAIDELLLDGGEGRDEEDEYGGYEDWDSRSGEGDEEDLAAKDEADEAVPSRLARLQQIRSRIHSLKARYEGEIESRLGLARKLQEKQSEVTSLLAHMQGSGVTERVSSYIGLQLKIQLMVLSSALSRLEGFRSVDEIPDIVLSIQASSLPAIFPNMKMHALVKQTVSSVRARLLSRFLQAFEDHLSEEGSRTWAGDEQHEGVVWAVFLKQARSWLLAYALVSVLPAALMETEQAVLEAFQLSVDEAFTPLWGRFFHHLKQGREAQSAQQMFWTFSFARSFLQMLLGLSTHITSTDQLRRLCDVDYRRAGQQQVVEKAVRFLRAHLAQILVAHDGAADDLCARLLEETLELDRWLFQYSPALTLCAVIYDAKPWFHRFLWMEQQALFDSLRQHCVDPEVAFADMFGCEGEAGDRRSDSAMSCYQSVFQCLATVQQCRCRYAHFPGAAQLVLSEVLLEPVLCLGLGLLLYRIRAQPVLFAVSQGQRIRIGDDALCRAQVKAFCRSVEYFQTALANDEEGLPRVAASSTRCKRRWGIVQSWMPKILITPTQVKLGFSLADLAKTALKTSDKFESATFEYRTKDVDVPQEGQLLSDCVLLIRGLAVTLADVLSQQMDA